MVDQKEHYQHSDDDPAPFFQYVNLNVLVDKVDDIVADKGIDDNGDKGSAEHDQKIALEEGPLGQKYQYYDR